MNLRLPFVLAALTCTALPGTVAQAQLPEPLAYVQNLQPIEGQTLFLKQFTCQAPGKPEAEGRLYVIRVNSRVVRVARIEYNEGGKYILDTGKSASVVSGYYQRYVVEQKPFTPFTMNAVLGLWRAFGTKFTLEKVVYRCSVS